MSTKATSDELVEPNPEEKTSEAQRLLFAQQHYSLATRAYTAEQVQQGHLWGRFRDGVQLLTIVATGHGGAILVLADKELHWALVVPGMGVAAITFVLLAWTAIQLGKIFEGDDYSDQKPKETSRVLIEYGTRWVPNSLDVLSEQILKDAADNYEINSGRSAKLAKVREKTLACLYMLFPVWIAVFAAKLLHAVTS